MQAIRPQTPQQPIPKPTVPPKGGNRSLQINIDSQDDAKAVIQHLGKIKEAFEFARRNFNVESIEFCIASDIRKDVDSILMGAVRWCRTYIKAVDVFDGNVLFPLPHYVEPKRPTPAPIEPPTLGKSQRLVRADTAAG